MDRSDIRMIQWNTRTKIILYIILAFIYLGGVFIWGLLMVSLGLSGSVQ